MTKKTKKHVEENPKSMMLIKSAFGSVKSFKLIPITDNCPYVECLFSPSEKIMVVISKFIKQSYHMMPKMDDNGDQVPVKGKPRPNGKDIREERRLVDTCSEHYVVTEEEIRELINMFAVNPDAFNIDEFFLSDSELVGVDTKEPNIVIV
jgi:hypothetical protein|tara:strand:- start:10640 stop:11089 length:450 start_codon:yes stop_codon:yes gene_type:complete